MTIVQFRGQSLTDKFSVAQLHVVHRAIYN